jgi:hypothetical protein
MPSQRLLALIGGSAGTVKALYALSGIPGAEMGLRAAMHLVYIEGRQASV